MPTIDGHHTDWATVCRWIDENRPDLAPDLEHPHPQHTTPAA